MQTPDLHYAKSQKNRYDCFPDNLEYQHLILTQLHFEVLFLNAIRLYNIKPRDERLTIDICEKIMFIRRYPK